VVAQISPAVKPQILLVENGGNVAITAACSVLYRYVRVGAQGIPGITVGKMGSGIPLGNSFIGGALCRELMDKAKRA
jgi:hypothetical protein